MADTNAKIIISAEDKTRIAFESVQQRMGKLTGAFSNMSGMLTTLGATAVAGYFITATKNFADYADEIGKAAQKVGTTTEALSALKYAAQLSDVSFEQLQTGLGKLAKTTEDFKDGSSSAVDAFSKIKLDPSTYKDTSELFGVIAERLSKMEDGAQKTAIAQELLGKSGKELIPLLNGGAAGLAAMTSEAKAFGLVITRDAARQAEQFNDDLLRLETAAGGLGREIAQKLVPSLADTAAAMTKAAQEGDTFWAVLRGIAGVGKLPLDLLFPDKPFTITSKITDLRSELNSLKNDAFHLKSGGLINEWLAGGNKAEIEQKIKVVENQIAAYEKFKDKLEAPPKSTSGYQTEAQTKGFEELAKGMGLASVKLAELNARQQEASAAFKAGTIDTTQYNEITASINKQRIALTQKTTASKKAGNQDAESAARFVEALIKQDATAGKSRAELIAYDAAHQKLNSTQKQIVASIVERINVTEQARAADEAWAEQIKFNQASDDEQLSALEESSAAEIAAIEDRNRAFESLATQYETSNEDLNIQLLASDKARIRAQVDAEHARSVDRINAMGLEFEEVQRLIDAETEHYQLKLQQIERSSIKTKSISQELGATFKSAFEDAVVGGEGFGDVLKGLEQDIIRLAARKTILDPLLSAFDNLLESFSSGSGGGGGNFITDFFSGLFENAKGGVYNSPSLSAYSGGVYTSPKMFAFANGGIFAEAGPEAIMPLSRGKDGKLGVQATGGGGANITVNLIESPGNGGQVNQRQEGENITLEIMVEKIEGMMGKNISKGRGIAGTIERQYGLSRAAGAY